MSGHDLEAEIASAFRASSFLHMKALETLGVPRSTIAELSGDHWGWGVVNAVEHPSEPGLYCLDPTAPPHLLLPVIDQGELIDLVAFRSSAPDSWLLRTGLGWSLGLERGLEPHTWGDPVPLAVSPLEWLKCGAQGLCVLDWTAPELNYLVGVPHLVCSTERQADLLRKRLSKPVRFPKITVSEGMKLAA